MTKRPNMRIKSNRKPKLEDTLATIRDYIPGAKIIDRKIVIPQAIVYGTRQVNGQQVLSGVPKIRAAVSQPREVRRDESTQTSGMDAQYREYRLNNLVRCCVNLRAVMATNKGHKVEIFAKDAEVDQDTHESLQTQHSDLLQHINDANKQVNLDNVAKLALVSQQLYGRSGFEIDLDKKVPRRLIPLNSYRLKPEFDDGGPDPWGVSSFEYAGKPAAYTPEEILYFHHNSLDGKMMGESDIEPILSQATTKRQIVEDILPLACDVSWSGIAVLQVDCSNLTPEDEDSYLNDLQAQFKPSNIIVTNQRFLRADIIDTKPNLDGIIHICEYLDIDIIGAFNGIPPFLVGRTHEQNRAIAYTELDQWINGDITNLQRSMRRQLDDGWIDYLAMQFLKLKPEAYSELDYRPRLVWNPIRIIDFVDTGATVAQLREILTRDEAYRILGLNPSDIEADLIAENERTQRVGVEQPVVIDDTGKA